MYKFNTAYNSVESTIKFVKDSEKLKLIKIDLVYPLSDHEVLTTVRDTIERENNKNDGDIKVCFMDAISSVPAVRFPFEAAIKLVREHNILSLVDGAHAIGNIYIIHIICKLHINYELIRANTSKLA